MQNFFSLIELIFGSYLFILIVSSISLIFKIYILRVVCLQSSRPYSLIRTRIYLSCVLIGALFVDISWIIVSIRALLISSPALATNSLTLILISRIAWIFYTIEYQSLALFLENLVDPFGKISTRQKYFIFIASVFSGLFLYSCLKTIFAFQPSVIQLRTQSIFPFYAIFILMPITIYYSLKKLKQKKYPRILKKQFLILIQFLITARLISDLIQYYPFNIFPGFFTNSYSIIGISTTLLTVALYFCARKIMGLRFLNFHTHVQEHHRYNFVDKFKDTLEELAKAGNIKELGHITQSFFKSAFDIPGNRVTLYLRTSNPIEGSPQKVELTPIEALSETFLGTSNGDLEKCINKVKILIYDEIDFNNFYDPNYADETIIKFLDSINADIFLPIYKNHAIIGYIIVERFARFNEFYSHIERDEMLVYASYLSNIINLLQNRNLDTLIYQEKELKEELYKKHQEINQYKESIYSFLKNTKRKEIGIIFYKQRHFVFANQAAKEIIKININTNQGSSLTKTLKSIAQQVEEYKSPQSCITKTMDGERILVNGVPNLERNHVIITVYYPDFSDIIMTQINNLKDPSLWDYLLYLETTKTGKLINQLVPGSGEHLLQFKINLLQIALSKKALLIEMARDDLMATVELLHHISMRASLHVITLASSSKNHEIAIKLFGINPLFDSGGENSKSLLEKLDGNGTLFIQNIEFLDIETQEQLAEFIKYGYYSVLKSDQKLSSSVRIICSSNQNLTLLAQEGSFSTALFNELKKTSISLPSLLTLPAIELTELAQGLAEQAIKTDDFKNLLDFTQKDKEKIIQSKPTSLHELKTRVQQLLAAKSKENHIDQEIYFDPAYETTDPDLVQAARLGKHALRDERLMVMLWNKYKNQNKIATLLGVNRSSVNRRLREYHLLP